MHCYQVTRMISNAHDNMISIFRADALCMWAYVLLGGVYSLIAMTFYAFRIWRVGGAERPQSTGGGADVLYRWRSAAGGSSTRSRAASSRRLA
jgi:hypothetical protein